MVNDKDIKVVPSGAALGADIAGLDLREELTPKILAGILEAWDKHLVLRFICLKGDPGTLVKSLISRFATKPTNRELCTI